MILIRDSYVTTYHFVCHPDVTMIVMYMYLWIIRFAEIFGTVGHPSSFLLNDAHPSRLAPKRLTCISRVVCVRKSVDNATLSVNYSSQHAMRVRAAEAGALAPRTDLRTCAMQTVGHVWRSASQSRCALVPI